MVRGAKARDRCPVKRGERLVALATLPGIMTTMSAWLRPCVLLAVVTDLACGPGKAVTEGSDTDPASTTTDPGTTDPGMTATTTSPTTGLPTTGPDDPTSTGTTGPGDDPCDGEWELPASVVADLRIHVVDATPSEAFDPGIVYPDGTPAACVRWDGQKLAGVRLAFGPPVGDGPESLLEVVVSDGERIYGTSSWPPEPGVYDGVEVVYTFTSAGGGAQVFDYVQSEGIGELDAQWVGKAPGEHITFQAKLTMPGDGAGADVGFEIDAVIAPGSVPSVEFCETLDTPTKCSLAGCALWVEAGVVDDLTQCTMSSIGYCAADIAATEPEYDSAFFAVVDGTVRLARSGGEGCSFFGTEHPSHWTECGAAGSPPECACVCVGGVCPGDAALDQLEACGLPEPCPDLDGGFGWDPADDCFFQAALVDAPAVLRTHTNFGDPDLDDRVYLRGDGTATWLQGECDVSCLGSCADRNWGVPRTCTLREPAFFTDCAAAVDQGQLAECHDPANWFTSCAVSTPVCP